MTTEYKGDSPSATGRCATWALCLLLAGCDEPAFQKPPQKAAWELAITTHACTTEQMTKAQSESKWCSENTQYFSTYCYGAAILRNCAARSP